MAAPTLERPTDSRQTTSGMIQSRSPVTGELIGEYPMTSLNALPDIMQRAREAQKHWETLGLQGRLPYIRAIQDSMYRNLDLMVDGLVREVGKPRFEALVEIWPTIELVAHQRRIAPRTLRGHNEFVHLVPHRAHRVEYRPYGVVGVIAPWNFPLILSIAPIIAALITGNAVIYKPSEYSPYVGEIIRKMIHEAGIDPDLMQIIHGYGDVGAALIKEHPDKICFTGSVPTGRKVAAAAGELLIPVTLELGGKDAAIVLRDADLDRTALGVTWAGIVNAGQACLSVERVYVERPIAEELVARMKRVLEEHVSTAAQARERTLGAITNEAQMRIIEGQVKEAVEQGATVVCGGKRSEQAGRFYEPTILTNVTPEMRVVRDETFGPVIVVVPIDSAEEGVEMANASSFGLTGSIWTRDRSRGMQLARQLKVGNAAVNDHIMSASTPNLPWGGVGDSGYGRERGPDGLLDMVYPQALSVDRIPLKAEFFWYPYTPGKYTLLYRALKFIYGPSLRDRLNAIRGRDA